MSGDRSLRADRRFLIFRGFFVLPDTGFRLRDPVTSKLQTQHRTFRVTLQDGDGLRRLRPQVLPDEVHVAQRCRQPDPPDAPSGCELQPAEQGKQLDPSLRAEEGMKLVDDDATQPAEKTWDLQATENERRFQ